MRRAFLAAVLLSCLTPAQAAKSDCVVLRLDEVHTLTFRSAVATVYVGNPAIADVTMVDSRHAFVQGKGYGRTNIVALNRDHVQVFNDSVIVVGNQGPGIVILNRGTQRITLACTEGGCEPAPTPGDDQKAYDAASSQASAHQNAARSMATAQASRN